MGCSSSTGNSGPESGDLRIPFLYSFLLPITQSRSAKPILVATEEKTCCHCFYHNEQAPSAIALILLVLLSSNEGPIARICQQNFIFHLAEHMMQKPIHILLFLTHYIKLLLQDGMQPQTCSSPHQAKFDYPL